MGIEKILGWIVYGLFAFYALWFCVGCRLYVKRGVPISFMSATQVLYFMITTLIFLHPALNKLYLILVWPLIKSGTFVFYMQGTPVVRFLTHIFMSLFFVGTGKNMRDLVSPPPKFREIYGTPFTAMIKADLSMILMLLFKRKGDDESQ